MVPVRDLRSRNEPARGVLTMPRTISTNYSSGLTLINTADSPVYIASGVTVASGSGVALYNAAPFYWSVTNRATALVAGNSFGVSLSGAGTLSNQGTITSSNTSSPGFT